MESSVGYRVKYVTLCSYERKVNSVAYIYRQQSYITERQDETYLLKCRVIHMNFVILKISLRTSPNDMAHIV